MLPTFRAALFVFPMALVALSTALADTPGITIAVVGANDGLALAPGAVSSHPFSVQVRDAQGAPMAGIPVSFGIDQCITLPETPAAACPPASTYGRFATSGPIETDSNGMAAAPAFTAGALPGAYNVLAGLFQDPATHLVVFTRIPIAQTALTVTQPITSAFSGAWFDPNQSGHGVLVEVLSNQSILAYWFTFDPEGTQQAWFGGSGQIFSQAAALTAYQTQGGRWIPNFDPNAIQQTIWGYLTLSFSDCMHGRIDFQSILPGYGSGHMDLTRLTQPAGLSCAVPAQ